MSPQFQPISITRALAVIPTNSPLPELCGDDSRGHSKARGILVCVTVGLRSDSP